MEPQNRILVSAISIVVFIVVGILLVGRWVINRNSLNSNGTAASGTAHGSITRAPVPQDAVVPEGQTHVPLGVANPAYVGPSGPNTEAGFRSFVLKIQKNRFDPETVIVNEGDTVHLSITAVDKGYDFTQPDYGFHVPLPPGKAKIVEFGAVATGKFTFFCELCGGIKSGSVGYLIVVPK